MYPDSSLGMVASQADAAGAPSSLPSLCGQGIISSIMAMVSKAMRSTIWFTLIAREMW